MNCAKEKVVAIKNSDYKCQITAVVAATITGEFFPVQLAIISRQNSALPPKSESSRRMGPMAQ